MSFGMGFARMKARRPLYGAPHARTRSRRSTISRIYQGLEASHGDDAEEGFKEKGIQQKGSQAADAPKTIS
jgi:hypothetical protein